MTNCQPHGRAFARDRVNGERAAEHARAFRDARQPEAGFHLARREAFAVVVNGEGHAPLRAFDDHACRGGGGVFDDVVQALLHDAIEIDLGRRVEQAVNVIDLRGDVESGSGGDFAGHRLDGFGQAEPVELIGMKVGRDLAHFFERMRDGGRYFIQLRHGARAVVRLREAEQRAVLDDQQVLTQAVVQFGGDAFALAFLRFDQLARKCLLRGLSPFKLRDAVFVRGENDSRSAERGQAEEPPLAIERRRHDYAQALPLGVPHAVAVGGDHFEGVFARRRVRIVSRAPRPGVDPIVVQAFQLVLESDLFRVDEAESGVLDLEILLPRPDPDCGFHHSGSQGLIVNTRSFDHDGRRQRMYGDGFGVNYRHALWCREPEPAVARLDAGGPKPAVAFGIEHAVAFAVGDRIDPPNFSLGEFVQFTFVDAVDAPVAAHPQIAAPVLQDLKDAVVEQPVPDRVAGEFAVLEPAQAAVVSSDPERAVAVFVKRAHAITRQSLRLSPRGAAAVFETDQPAVGADPERAVATFDNRLDIGSGQTEAGQPFGRGESRQISLLIPVQTHPVSKPERARSILMDRRRRSAQIDPRRYNSSALQYSQSAISPDPQASFAVFVKRSHQ